MNELIDLAFGDADAAHTKHLASESFSEHMALGEFYAGAREAVDAIVEAAIGLDMPVPEVGDIPILQRLENSYVELKDMKDTVCAQDTTLENLFDELTGVYAKAIYKLKRLK